MKETVIRTQADLDSLQEVKADESVTVSLGTEVHINKRIDVYGKLKIDAKIICKAYIYGWENSTLNIYGWENSTLNIDGRGNSTLNIDGRGNSTLNIDGRENSTLNIYGRENSTLNIYGRGNSTLNIYGWENSTLNIYGWENSTLNIDGRGNSTLNIDGRGNSAIRIKGKQALSKMVIGIAVFCCLWIPSDLKIKVTKKSKTSVVIKYNNNLPYLERHGIETKKGKVILFKRVSVDFKTQEGERNETTWAIGSEMEHPAWNPTQQECGEGKFHACSTPFFCDEFRTKKDDRYIAIEVPVKELYEWKNATYPNKIAFRVCKVLYEVDRKGNKK